MTTNTRVRGFAVLLAAHLAAGGLAVLIWCLLADWAVLPRTAAADAGAMLLMFCACYCFKNTSLFDAWWSLAPIAMVWTWAAVTDLSFDQPGTLALCVLVTFWGLRLTANWASGWQGLHHEDWRYLELQEKTGRGWWLTSLVGLHVYPTTIVFLCCCPAKFAISSSADWSGWTTLAALVTTLGVLIETVADLQLHRFRRVAENRDQSIQTGLWRWSRHPNYLGELLFWWGLLFFGLSTGEMSPWWALAPAFLTLMLRFSSIPMMEARLLRTRPGYAELQSRIAPLVPGLP
ncbi:MAG: DUF1295 domain-containing protein [Myxococcota bacterium]|nr:DUF1295 domain-containing protein [Myxococcota bacterium]